MRAAGQPLPEHATLVQLCDLLIHANEERDAQRAGLQTQAAAKPYVSPLDSRKRGAAPPADPRPDMSARFEQRWEDYRQQTTATAKRLLASLEGKSVR